MWTTYLVSQEKFKRICRSCALKERELLRKIVVCQVSFFSCASSQAEADIISLYGHFCISTDARGLNFKRYLFVVLRIVSWAPYFNNIKVDIGRFSSFEEDGILHMSSSHCYPVLLILGRTGMKINNKALPYPMATHNVIKQTFSFFVRIQSILHHCRTNFSS